MKRLLVVLALAVLGGCVTPPSYEESSTADYGPPPNDHQEIIKKYMSRHLKDPESARFEFEGSPIKAWRLIGTRKYGWAACANINAKNSFGGYTGMQRSYFFIRDNAVLDAEHSGKPGSYIGLWVDKRCNAL